MRIQSYTSPLNFKSSSRIVHENPLFTKNNPQSNVRKSPFEKTLLYSNYTNFFREDLEEFSTGWLNFRKIIAKAFSDASKVNVYDFAASDGSEAYSLIISLIEELGERGAEKYFPIEAFDIDAEIVEKARNGKMDAAFGDIQAIKYNTGNKIDKYFNVEKGDGSTFRVNYLTPRENIKNRVNFNCADIADKVDEIKPSNSLVLCRNFWPYLNWDTTEKIFSAICEKLDESSMIVLGSFDLSRRSLIYNILEKNGFKEIYQCTFQKQSKMPEVKFPYYL